MGTNINCLSKNKSLKNLRRADKKKIAIKLLEASTHKPGLPLLPKICLKRKRGQWQHRTRQHI